MIGLRVIMIAAIYPGFLLIVRYPGVGTLLLTTAILGLFSQASGAAGFVALAEAIPKRVRSTLLATVYSLGVAIFGGTTQAIITWLMHATGDIYAPAHYLAFGSVVCLIAMLMMDETAPVASRTLDTRAAEADLGL
jgi:succinate-acetate transporter protein